MVLRGRLCVLRPWRKGDADAIVKHANNINVEVLGTSPGFPVDRTRVRAAILDNPMGQGDERTPVIIVRAAD